MAGRGRPRTIKPIETITEPTTTVVEATPVETQEEPVNVVRNRTSREEITERARVSLREQDRGKLSAPQKPGYKRRVVNDVGNRVSQFELAGYKIVDEPGVVIGDPSVNMNKSTGTGARINVGKTRSSENTEAVLMEIREEFYTEDQNAKQNELNVREQSILRTLRKEDGFYGENKITKD